MSEYRGLGHYVTLPNNWSLLNHGDQIAYNAMRLMFLNSDRKKQSKLHSFRDIFEATRKYVQKGDSRDWTRALVCGIIWLTCCLIVVNTKQIQILTGRSKSSINGSLQALGYKKTNTDHATMQNFLNQFPPLKNNPNELRQWTFRILSPLSQKSSLPSKTSSSSTEEHSPDSTRLEETNLDFSSLNETDEFFKLIPEDLNLYDLTLYDSSLSSSVNDNTKDTGHYDNMSHSFLF